METADSTVPWEQGEKQAWELLRAQQPENVCRNSGAGFNAATQSYRLPLFGTTAVITPEEESIVSSSEQGRFVLEKLAHFSRLSTLRYLIHARNIPATGKLVAPESLSGGAIYGRGSHILPLDRLAETFGTDSRAFFLQGARLGAERVPHGDAALRIIPFPRLPVIVVLWLKDDEFPARAHVLVDASCRLHLPADVMWATLVLCLEVMLHLQQD